MIGNESYDNQVKYGGDIFLELETLQREGYIFEGKLHKVDVVCCCDWKAAACIEGRKVNSQDILFRIIDKYVVLRMYNFLCVLVYRT